MSARRNFEWPELLTADGRGIAFGGDYNPDQWSEDIWDDDIRLMKQAGVNTVDPRHLQLGSHPTHRGSLGFRLA